VDRQAFLLRLSDAVRSLVDPVHIQQVATKLLGEYLDVDRAAYGEMRSDNQIMDVFRDWTSPGTSSVAGAYRIDDFEIFAVALRQGKPAVMEDALNDPAVSSELYEKTWKVIGARAAIACALIKEERVVAAIFVHEADARRWSEGEISVVVEVGERTWAAVERARAEAALHESEVWLAGQKEAFQSAMNGASLEVSLGILARTVCKQLGNKARCGFYIASDDGTELNHVVGMPSTYAECVDGFRIGEDSLACGLAVYTGQPVITADVRGDSRWKEWLWLSEKHEFRACWSFPVETLTGKVVGTLAMYFKEPRSPNPHEMELATGTARAAAIIIARHQQAEERGRAEVRLRESEFRSRSQSAELRAVLESMSDAVYIGNREGITIANQAALDQLGYVTREELNRSIAILSSETETRDFETGLRIFEEDLPFVRALNGEQVVREMLIRHRITGEDRILRSAASPVRIDGQSIGAVAVNSDITKEKKAEVALREAEKLSIVGRLASSIAHEINNPLEAAINLVYLAERAAISPETRGYLQQAQAELARVSLIASETLRFQRQAKQ
jgi:PAS domain S-box-containing protein